jgi:hypothetical protein
VHATSENYVLLLYETHPLFNSFVPTSDIDECQEPDVYPCLHGTCTNMPGTYRCSAKKSTKSLSGINTALLLDMWLCLVVIKDHRDMLITCCVVVLDL